MVCESSQFAGHMNHKRSWSESLPRDRKFYRVTRRWKCWMGDRISWYSSHTWSSCNGKLTMKMSQEHTLTFIKRTLARAGAWRKIYSAFTWRAIKWRLYWAAHKRKTGWVVPSNSACTFIYERDQWPASSILASLVRDWLIPDCLIARQWNDRSEIVVFNQRKQLFALVSILCTESWLASVWPVMVETSMYQRTVFNTVSATSINADNLARRSI